MTALKPCPWCGDHPSSMRSDAWENGRKIGCARIWCPTCCADKAAIALTPDLAYEQAAEAWGRRAPDPEREAMARVCIAASDFVAVQGRYGFEQQAFALLDKALTDLERARKGTT